MATECHGHSPESGHSPSRVELHTTLYSVLGFDEILMLEASAFQIRYDG